MLGIDSDASEDSVDSFVLTVEENKNAHENLTPKSPSEFTLNEASSDTRK